MPNKAELLAGLIDANGDVLSDNLDNVSVAFSEITSKPTTLSGYGITDGLTASDITGKADLASPTFTGTPAAPTATTGTNTTQLATTAFVQTELSALVDSAPASLDTLNELAAALGDDANFSTTVTTSLGTKAPLASPTFTGTPAAPTATAGTNTTQIATTAYVQGEGFLTSFDVVDDTTPQLGGDLDTNGNAILFGSSKWSVELDTGDNDLLFKYNGTTVFKIASNGAITSANEVTAYGSP